jgi:hypothetical protein
MHLKSHFHSVTIFISFLFSDEALLYYLREYTQFLSVWSSNIFVIFAVPY